MQVDSKVTLGVGGIVVVLMAVLCSLGIFAYAKVTTTLLTVEVRILHKLYYSFNN